MTIVGSIHLTSSIQEILNSRPCWPQACRGSWNEVGQNDRRLLLGWLLAQQEREERGWSMRFSWGLEQALLESALRPLVSYLKGRKQGWKGKHTLPRWCFGQRLVRSDCIRITALAWDIFTFEYPSCSRDGLDRCFTNLIVLPWTKWHSTSGQVLLRSSTSTDMNTYNSGLIPIMLQKIALD